MKWCGWFVISNPQPVGNIPEPVKSGLYQISIDGQCLKNDGTLTTCDTDDSLTQWTYDSTNKTLQTTTGIYQGSTQVLYQPSNNAPLVTEINQCLPYEDCEAYPFSSNDDSNYKTFVLSGTTLMNQNTKMCYDKNLNPGACYMASGCSSKFGGSQSCGIIPLYNWSSYSTLCYASHRC